MSSFSIKTRVIGMFLLLCCVAQFYNLAILCALEQPKEELPCGAIKRLGKSGATTDAGPIIFSPDGSLVAFVHLAGPGGGWVYVYYTGTGDLVGTVHESAIYTQHVEFLPYGNCLAVVSGNDRLLFWDLVSSKPICQRGLDRRDSGACSLTISPDGKTLASSVVDAPQQNAYRITLWETASALPRRRIFSIALKEYGYDLGYSPDGRFLVVGLSKGASGLIDLATGKQTVQLEAFATSAGRTVFTPDGRILASVGNDHKFGRKLDDHFHIHICDALTGKTLFRIKGSEDGEQFIAMCLQGRVIATANRAEQEIRLWDVTNGQAIDTLRWGKQRWGGGGVACSPDGKLLAVSSADGTALLWDLTTLPAIKALKPISSAEAVLPAIRESELTAKEVDLLWDNLADAEASKAYDALWKLVLAPSSSLPVIRLRLKPILVPAPEIVNRWIADLNNDDPKTRENASLELAKIAQGIEPELRKALKGTASPEMRNRLELLLQGLRPPITDGVKLRPIRAIEALERIGNKDAIDLLRDLSKGHADAWQTKDAKLALERLTRRQALLAPQK